MDTTPNPHSNPVSRALSAPPSSADFVIVRIILVLIMIGSAATIVVHLWPSRTIDYTMATATAASLPAPEGAASNVSLAHTGEAVATITDPTIAQRLLVATPVLFVALLVGVGAWLLYGITARIHRGDAFGRSTITRLRALAIMVLLGGVVAPFLMLGTRFVLSDQLLAAPEVLFTIDATTAWPVIVGLLLVLLTEVFTRGRALSDDLEGLV